MVHAALPTWLLCPVLVVSVAFSEKGEMRIWDRPVGGSLWGARFQRQTASDGSCSPCSPLTLTCTLSHTWAQRPSTLMLVSVTPTVLIAYLKSSSPLSVRPPHSPVVPRTSPHPAPRLFVPCFLSISQHLELNSQPAFVKESKVNK